MRAFTWTRSAMGRVTSTCVACGELAAVGPSDRLVGYRQRAHVCPPPKSTASRNRSITPGGTT